MLLDIGTGCFIRSYEKDDIPNVARYANNHEIWKNMMDRFPWPYHKEDAETWVDIAMKEEPEQNFVIANPEGFIGAIGIKLQYDVYRKTAEMGYWLGEPFWGRGITSAAAEKFSDWAMDNYSLVKIFAGVFDWNPASARVLEKAGFELEARLKKAIYKDGKIVDQLYYARFRE